MTPKRQLRPFASGDGIVQPETESPRGDEGEGSKGEPLALDPAARCGRIRRADALSVACFCRRMRTTVLLRGMGLGGHINTECSHNGQRRFERWVAALAE